MMAMTLEQIRTRVQAMMAGDGAWCLLHGEAYSARRRSLVSAMCEAAGIGFKRAAADAAFERWDLARAPDEAYSALDMEQQRRETWHAAIDWNRKVSAAEVGLSLREEKTMPMTLEQIEKRLGEIAPYLGCRAPADKLRAMVKKAMCEAAGITAADLAFDEWYEINRHCVEGQAADRPNWKALWDAALAWRASQPTPPEPPPA